MFPSLPSDDPIGSPFSQERAFMAPARLRKSAFWKTGQGSRWRARGAAMTSDTQKVTVFLLLTLLIFVNAWLLLQLSST